MIATENTAKRPASRTGSLATLSNLPSADGSGAPSHRPAHLLLALALALAAFLALTAAPALAFTTHSLSTSFGSSGSGDGQLALAPADFTFQNPAGLVGGSGVAVNDATHDVYVADTGNHRVVQFSSTGAFVRAWGWGVADGSVAFQTCTSGCQQGISGAGAGQFESPLYVAVDNSGGLSNGDVYVADTVSASGAGTDLIQKFDPSGNPIAGWGSGGQLDGSAATGGPFSGELAGIAVDASGNLFVNDLGQNVFEFAQDGTPGTTVPVPGAEYPSGLAADSAGDLYRAANGNGQVDRLDASGDDLGTIEAVLSSPGAPYTSTGFAVDASDGGLYSAHDSEIRHYRDDGSGNVVEFDGSICTVGGKGCQPTDTFGSGDLAGAAGLAVDPSGHLVYAADTAHSRVAVFAPAILPDVLTNAASSLGKHSATLNGHLDPAGGGDVSDCHFQYTDDASFQANGYSGAQTISCDQSTPISSAADVTATPTGFSPETTYHFRLLAANANGPNRSAEQTFTTPPAVTLAISAADPVGGTTATLHGHVDSSGGGDITTCRFQYTDDASFQSSGFSVSQTAPCAPAAPISSPTDVAADLTGLSSDTTYHVRLVATNSDGTTRTDDLPFTTLPLPVIGFAAAKNLTPTAADLTARINPKGSDTVYHFEYGTDTSYGTSVPASPADIGSGSSDVSVSRHITGLTPNTTYHWRLIATNANGTSGANDDHTFIYDTSGSGLPDGRAYELVSPSHKNGALLGDALFSLLPSVGDAGNRVTIASIQCFADAQSCNANGGGPIGSQYAFSRTPAGWTASAFSAPGTQFRHSNTLVTSADTGASIFTAPTPTGDEADYYLRHPDGSFAEIGPGYPPAHGDRGAALSPSATTDLSHIVWTTSQDDMRWPFDATTGSLLSSAYEYAGTGNSQPLLVGVSGGPGSTDLISTCGTVIGGSQAAQGAISATDAGTIYFSAQSSIFGGPCSGGSGGNVGIAVPVDTIYARIDNDGPSAHTVPISQRSLGDCTTPACTSSAPHNALFQGAAADGSRAYFTSTQQLTDDASQDDTPGDTANNNCRQTTGPNGCNLYLYDFSRPAGHELVDVSAGDSSGNGPRVSGVVGIARDGSHVYFVAQGVLTADPNAQGQAAADGANNLYAYDAGSGDLSFVADLPNTDQDTWGGSSFAYAGRKSNVTPDGRYLLFQSYARLTPDDSSTSGAGQLFRYDDQTGDLTRISIGENGFADNGNRSTPDTCNQIQCSSDAIFITPSANDPADRTDPSMSHDGSRIFFISPLALTPHALDQVQIGSDSGIPSYAENVYEWHSGHVSLISDGRDAAISQGGSTLPCGQFSAVCLLGASGSGDDVFFTTVNSLVPQDGGTELDVYDARVGGGIPYTPPPPSCQGDACRGAGTSAPTPTGAGSAAFNGAGNPKPHRKSHKKHHRKHKHHKRHHARTNSNRGGHQ